MWTDETSQTSLTLIRLNTHVVPHQHEQFKHIY